MYIIQMLEPRKQPVLGKEGIVETKEAVVTLMNSN